MDLRRLTEEQLDKELEKGMEAEIAATNREEALKAVQRVESIWAETRRRRNK